MVNTTSTNMILEMRAQKQAEMFATLDACIITEGDIPFATEIALGQNVVSLVDVGNHVNKQRMFGQDLLQPRWSAVLRNLVDVVYENDHPRVAELTLQDMTTFKYFDNALKRQQGR